MLKLFEIKLFAYSPEKFEENISTHRKKFYSNCENQNLTKKQIDYIYSTFCGSKNTYENYSIGYLIILYDGSSLHYEAKIMLSQKNISEKELQKRFDIIEMDNSLTAIQKEKRKLNIIGSRSLVAYKPPLFTSKKRYMSNYHIDGKYTRTWGLTNLEIVQAMKKDITDIQEYDILKNIYFDLSYFNKIADYIDYVKLFENYNMDRGLCN